MYVVTTADNVSFDVNSSDLFDTKKQATQYMWKTYRDIIDNLEGSIESHSIENEGFVIETYGSDYYYGKINYVTYAEDKIRKKGFGGEA